MHSCPFSWFCWRKMSDHEQFVASPKENTSDKEQPCAIFRKSQCFISSCFWFINVTLYVHPSGKKVQGSMSGASEAIFFSFKDAKEMDSFTAETSLTLFRVSMHQVVLPVLVVAGFQYLLSIAGR